MYPGMLRSIMFVLTNASRPSFVGAQGGSTSRMACPSASIGSIAGSSTASVVESLPRRPSAHKRGALSVSHPYFTHYKFGPPFSFPLVRLTSPPSRVPRSASAIHGSCAVRQGLYQGGLKQGIPAKAIRTQSSLLLCREHTEAVMDDQLET